MPYMALQTKFDHYIVHMISYPLYIYPNISSYPRTQYILISQYIPIYPYSIYPHSLLLKVTQSILMTWWTNAINQTPTWGVMNPVFPCNESNKNAEGVTQYSKGYFVWHEDSLPQFSLCANCVPWFLPFANTTREKYRKELPRCRYNYRSYSLPNISAQEFASFFISLSLTVFLVFTFSRLVAGLVAGMAVSTKTLAIYCRPIFTFGRESFSLRRRALKIFFGTKCKKRCKKSQWMFSKKNEGPLISKTFPTTSFY